MKTGKICICLVIGMMVFGGQAEADWTIGDLEAASGLNFNGDIRQFATGAAAYELMGGNKVYDRVFTAPGDGQQIPVWRVLDLVDVEVGIPEPPSISEALSDIEVATGAFYQGSPDYTPVNPFEAAVEIDFEFPLWNGAGDDVALFFVFDTIMYDDVEIKVDLGGGYQTILTPILSGDLKADYNGKVAGEVYIATLDFSDMGFYGETSRITIDMAPPYTTVVGLAASLHAVPGPGAILLGGLGVSLVGWMRRRRCI